jgi:hypothetical protein
VTFLGNVIRSIASERDGLDFERNVSWTDPAKQIREKIARMDDLFLDNLFSMTDYELLQEATEQGIDVSAVGGAGRAAFERAQVLVGRKRLALVGRGMAEDAGRPPQMTPESAKQRRKATTTNWRRLLIAIPACVVLLAMTSRLDTKVMAVTKDHVTTLFWIKTGENRFLIAKSVFDPEAWLDRR